MTPRARAVKLLAAFFANDNEAARRAVFNAAFDGAERSPLGEITFAGGSSQFAAHAVDTLLAWGASDPGRSALARLIEHMAAARGFQPHPDYAQLPRELNTHKHQPIPMFRSANPTPPQDNAGNGGAAPPRLFISYSHDTPEHMARVLALSQRLRREGIASEIDQYESNPDVGWPTWCDNAIEEAEFVLVVCTETYLRRFRKLEEPSRGLGVKFEGHVITQEIYDAGARNKKFIPVYFEPEDEQHIPVLLRGASRFRLPQNYAGLYRLLTNQPAIKKEAIGEKISLGQVRTLAPLEPREVKLPATRAAELAHCRQLIENCREIARRYSPLHAIPQRTNRSRVLTPSSGFEHQIFPHLRHVARPKRADQPLEQPQEPREYTDVCAAFKDVPRVTLLADPGGGKSTTLRKLAIDLAEAAIQNLAAPLPLLADLGTWTESQPLVAFLQAKAPEIGGAFEKLKESNRLILLLDGLNELPSRDGKLQEIRAISTRLNLVVSCRRADHTGELDLGLDTLTIEPLTPPQVRAAAHHWVEIEEESPEVAEQFFWQLAGDEKLKAVFDRWVQEGGSEENFWGTDPGAHWWLGYDLWQQHIPDPHNLVRLAANPFLFTMLYSVWWESRSLPHNRSELFRTFIGCLLARERLANADTLDPIPEGANLLDGLRDLAWKMQHRHAAVGEEGFGVLTAIARTDVKASYGAAFVEDAIRTTIMEGGDLLRFRHQLLQEYFTANALRHRLHEPATALWPADRWWERNGWEETAILLAGFYAADCTRVMEWLADAQPEVAADCILRCGATCPEATHRHLQAQWLPRLTNLETDPRPEARAAVGRALGKLNLDNRRGVGLGSDGLPEIDWVEIPAGEFIYQEGERRSSERFWIARYPITNAQYKAFLDAKDGYANHRWWQGLTDPKRTPRPSEWTESNHPRETVSWWEAMAFCAWLTERMEDRPGREIRLPLEWEWERAARGRDGREYPWGNEFRAGYANVDEIWGNAGPHDLNRTSPVGIYPEGASPEGVVDLSGNVWERCWNEYSSPGSRRKSGKERRVLRGGSWSYDPDLARAGYRRNVVPALRDFYIGFRVVSASPIR